MADNQQLKEIINRIKYLRGLKQGEIAKHLDTSPTYLSDMIHGRVPFTQEFYSNLKEVFPECISEVSSNTIIGNNYGSVGNGNNNTINNTNPAQSSTENVEEAEVAIVPQELHREPNINIYTYTRENDVETQPIVKQFSTHDLFFRVQNSAMAPKIIASDIVALQRVGINDSIPGCVYMIDHSKLGTFLRKVIDLGDTLRLSAYNSEYPEFTVSKADVYNLARVVGLIRTDI